MLNIEALDIQYITTVDGKKSSVILPIDQFLQLLEDLDDLAVVIARRDEPTISHAQLRAELKAELSPAAPTAPAESPRPSPAPDRPA